jgi:dTDP-4-dehydrorhamnose reductase
MATYVRRRVEIPGVRTARVELTEFASLKEMMRETRPEAIIHLAAISQPNDCEREPEASRRVNVEATVNLAGLAADRGIPLVFTSTDLVFDGRHSPYNEKDPISPVNLYAEQKVAAETGIRARHPAASICRMSLMFGSPSPVSHSFIQPFLEKMRAGESLRLFTDEFRTPLGARYAIEGLLLALRERVDLLHLAGPERISRHDFGLMMARILEIDSAKIIPCRQADVPMPAPRPPDVSLDISRARALGFKPSSLDRQIEELKGQV